MALCDYGYTNADGSEIRDIMPAYDELPRHREATKKINGERKVRSSQAQAHDAQRSTAVQRKEILKDMQDSRP